MNRRILAFLLLLVATFEEGLTTTTANNSNSNTTVAIFKVQAKREVYSVSVEIYELEKYTGETYNLSHQNCYVRFEPTNNIDVSTLRDDVKSFNLLLPVIKDLADSETNYIILNYHQEIIYSMENSLVTLNNLITALENNNNEGEESNADNDNSLANHETDTVSQKTDHCMQLDKAVKLSALKLQVKLTYDDISAI